MSSYNGEKIKARRDARRAAGLCTDCGKEPAFGHYLRCADCIYKETVRRWKRKTRESMDRDNARQNLNYRKAIQEGRCPVCKRENPDARFKQCPECRRKAREYWHRRYVHKPHPPGICPRCDRPSRPGAVLCEVHYEKAIQAGRIGLMVQDRKRHPWRLDEAARKMKRQE